MTIRSLLRRPSAFVPLVMSLAALTIVVGFLAMYGVVHQEDEGTAARIFQILIAAQVPFIAAFAINWLPVAPRQALVILGLQAAGAIAALAPVFLLEL